MKKTKRKWKVENEFDKRRKLEINRNGKRHNDQLVHSNSCSSKDYYCLTILLLASSTL